MSHTSALLRDRRFLAYFGMQALAALNHSLLRAALFVLLVGGLAEGSAITLAPAAALAYIVPFFLVAPLAGQLGDRLDRARWARRLKLLEIALMALGAVAIASASTPFMLGTLVLLGAHVAAFSPVKYALIPELLDERGLPAANGLVQASGFAALIFGTLAGSLVLITPEGPIAVAAAGLGIAIFGWMIALLVPTTPAFEPELPVDPAPWRDLRRQVDHVRARPEALLPILAIAWFWFSGALLLAQLPVYSHEALTGTWQVETLLLAVFTVGVAIGALLAGRLAGGRISLTSVPFAALAMAGFSLDLAFAADGLGGRTALAFDVQTFLATPGAWRVLVGLALASVAAGLFVVPLYALLQARAEPARRARVFAVSTVANAVFILLASLTTVAVATIGPSLVPLVMISAVGNLVIALLVCRWLPAYVMKGLFQAIFRLLYRVEVTGLENIERAGPRTLVVVNHFSNLDGPLMMAFLGKIPAFAVSNECADRWWVKPFGTIADVHGIDPTRPLETKKLVAMVKQGRPVVIFPEGRVSVTGALMKIYPGAAFIAEKSDAAIVPVRVDGAELTPLSCLKKGEARRRWFPKIRITILEPRHLEIDETQPLQVRRSLSVLQLYDIMSDMQYRTTRTGATLFDALLQARAVHGGAHRIVDDMRRQPLSYNRIVAGAMAFGRLLARETEIGERVGVLLPNVAATAVTFFALQAFGRVPAMLNYSAKTANMKAATHAAQICIIVTSRTFVERAELEPVVSALGETSRVVWLEDLKDEIGPRERLRALWEGRFAGRIHRRLGIAKDDPAVVLFTSGSEGRPKAVVLSHRNVLSNCTQVAARVDYNQLDKCFDALPLFHSFGLTGGFLLPCLTGTAVFLYPSPLHYRIVPEIVYETDSTIIFGTNTFLKGYGRKADPYDFRSVRYVFAGAEPVQEETKRLYADKFGLRILTGYGATEASPGIAMNTAMHNRSGTVGRFLPGLDWRIEPVEGLRRGGRLWIKGPNVMLGYLRYEQPGVLDAPKDGWYDTGDIVDVDDEGYVWILGRAKRFAKIAGEMVSLAAAEILVAEISPGVAHAVVCVRDVNRGEQLVLVTEDASIQRTALLAAARERELSELVVPAEVIRVDEVPVLLTGKPDYVSVQQIAEARHGLKEAI